MKMTYAEMLRKAADHIEKVGLHKGQYFRNEIRDMDKPEHERPCCTMGAVKVVTGEPDYGKDGKRRRDQMARLLNLPETVYIPDWNDKPSQRKGRVVAALRKAAARAEAEGL